MYFGLLQNRLLERLRRRIRNGEFTERQIARLTGLSQPHIHNVLKGEKILSPESADLVLLQLKISLFDLFDPEEVDEMFHVFRTPRSSIEVYVLDGLIGPGHPFPLATRPAEKYPFQEAALWGTIDPVLAWLEEDPAMGDLVRRHELALLDRSEVRRTFIEPEALYAVSFDGQSAIRRMRRGHCCLFLLTEERRGEPRQWQRLPLDGLRVTEVIRAKVVRLSAQPDWNLDAL